MGEKVLSLINSLFKLILILIVLFVSFPLGGVPLKSYVYFEAAIFILGSLFFLKSFLFQERVKFKSPFLLGLFLLFLIGLIQIIPLPHAELKILSPSYFKFLSENDLLSSALTPISVYSYKTIQISLKILSLIVIFILIKSLFVTKKSIFVLLGALIALGLFQSVFSYYQFFNDHYNIFGFENIYAHSLSGTYVNKNHFACLISMILFISIGVLGYLLIKKEQNVKNYKIAALFYFMLSAVIFIFITLLFSQSRAAILIFSFLVILYLILLCKKSILSIKNTLITGLLFILLILALVALDHYYVDVKLIPNLPNLEQFIGRFKIWKAAWLLFLKSPLFGFGLGNFDLALPVFIKEKFPEYLIINYAHNDYLQLFCEAGIVGSALLFIPFLFYLNKLKLKQLSPSQYPLWLALCFAILGLAIHSLFDFNFYIPANICIWSVLFALTENLVKN